MGDSCSRPLIEDLNQAILAATDAIKDFPGDYRGYQQRATIYQALVESKPEFLPQALADLTQAQSLNPNSPEITRSLASLYALKGDSQNTIYFLAQTVSLEPTKAQNFYDLARLQQQAGLLPQALETYTNLLTIVTDPTQINQVKSEKTALENLLSQNPNVKTDPSIRPSLSPSNPTITIDAPTLQASTSPGLIIAAPESQKDISVSNLTDSNSLSGTATLPANQKEINLKNTQLTSSSQVYLTITQGGKNQTLQVLGKSADSFTIGLDSPISENIVFKWWIIN
jgi:tetratricopeptide (TPR) repeat protein